MKENALETRRRALEESFFKDQDARLLTAMREKAARAEKKAALSESSGLTNPHLLEQLLALEIDSETLAALTLIPLVEVAWADGSVAPQERDAVLAAADAVGITPESESYLLLDHWLQKAPPATLLEAWESYVAGLSETLSPDARRTLRHDVMERVKQVASAAGGFLGLGGRISSSEQKVLDRLEGSFG